MENKKNVTLNKKPKVKWRKWIQLFFFLLIAAIAINKSLVENGGGITWFSSASLHAICPFGGVETIYNLLTVGTYIQKVHVSALILLGLVTFLAIVLGPVFCGWICPLGTIQEWVSKIGKKIFKKKYNQFIPSKVDKPLRWLRVVFLVWVIFVTAKSGTLMFQNADPFYALFNFWTGEVAPMALAILGATLVGSLFISRPWCKYLCPYGAVLGFFNKLKFIKPSRNSSTCISCKKCDQVCPMNIEVSTAKSVRDLSCISCFECTSDNACPVPETVTITWRS
ncbi:4Fe-4S binding protein [Fusibacter bizertensis]